MRLNTNIFLWITLSTVVPLTLLTLAATYWAEQTYRNEAHQEIRTALDLVTAEIDRRLQSEREIIERLAETPSMTAFLPVLAEAGEGREAPDFARRSTELTGFLQEFQGVVPGLFTLRLLDRHGNTLIKVTGGRATVPLFEGLHGIVHAEPEIDADAFAAVLRALPFNEPGYAALPHRHLEPGAVEELPLLDYIVPLHHHDQVVGYLAVNAQGDQIDRILDVAPRPYRGELSLFEYNPDHPARHAALLYHDSAPVRFGQIRQLVAGTVDHHHPGLFQQLDLSEGGKLTSPNGNADLFFREYFPYPNSLVSWVIVSQVAQEVVSAPFYGIRRGIVLFAVVALLLALLLARYGACKITRPVTQLSRGLKAYADGAGPPPVERHGIQEIDALGEAYDYMANRLEKARRERDKAQAMMVRNAKLASIGAMAAGIGHEINNPLNNILSLAKLCQRTIGQDDERARSDLNALREEALRASEIVRGVLNFARQVPVKPTRFEVAPWLDDAVTAVVRLAEAADVRVERLCPEAITIEGDRGQLLQAVINLLTNAIQASPTGSSVQLLAQRHDGDLIIEVRDAGSGIPDSVIGNVFDPFFTSKATGEGSGLGLSISLGIVEQHGGDLHIANRDDGGVSASIRLPLPEASGAPHE